jgi:hypothetical protein
MTGYVFKTDAIALSSPSGRMSGAARKAALKRIHDQLFPPGFWDVPAPTTEHRRQALLRSAADLRDLASRGMNARAFIRKAQELETEAANIT